MSDGMGGTDAAARPAGLLSVIVPVYNLAGYIEACVQSLQQQTYAPMEILLVDDGSTDRSGALCDALAADDARIRVIHQANGGQSAARNAGLSAARGQWIGFVDGDDTVLPDMYATLIALCVRHGAQIGACTFNYVFPDHEAPLSSTGEVRVYTRREALERLPTEADLRFEVCPKVFARETIGDARFLEKQLFEEIRFTRLTLPRADRIVYADTPFYRYTQKRAGNTNSAFPPQKLDTVAECDAFVKELAAEGLTTAAKRMEAFTLEFLIRLYVNAVQNGADGQIVGRIVSAYRQRFRRAQSLTLRRLIFYVSPKLYDSISQRLHRRA